MRSGPRAGRNACVGWISCMCASWRPHVTPANDYIGSGSIRPTGPRTTPQSTVPTSCYGDAPTPFARSARALGPAPVGNPYHCGPPLSPAWFGQHWVIMPGAEALSLVVHSRSTGIAKRPAQSFGAVAAAVLLLAGDRLARGRRRGSDEAAGRLRRTAYCHAEDDDLLQRSPTATGRDLPPDYVRVLIDGIRPCHGGDGGTDWKQGVDHHFATKLPVGVHDVAFEAADTRRFTDAADGGTVTIEDPPPPPTPAPTPVPRRRRRPLRRRSRHRSLPSRPARRRPRPRMRNRRRPRMRPDFQRRGAAPTRARTAPRSVARFHRRRFTGQRFTGQRFARRP